MSIDGHCWREGLGQEAISGIESALDQLRSDEQYEWLAPTGGNYEKILRRGGFTPQNNRLLKSFNNLYRLGEHAEQLIKCIDELTRVAAAGLHDRGLLEGLDTGSYGLEENLIPQLRWLARNAPLVAEGLKNSHSSMPGEGQGRNSTMGRESDLRAYPAGDESLSSLGLRSPKDKFGFRVVVAIFLEDTIRAVERPRKAADIKELLNLIWLESGREKKQNWHKVIRERSKILDYAKRILADRRHEEGWDLALNGESSLRGGV